MMGDTLQRFLFENAAVRGELVEISDAWRQVQARREYPDAVDALLGEMLAAAALLSANLKFNGALVMQIQGDGPVRLLVVECDSDLRLRAMAKLAPDAAIEPEAGLQQLVNAHGRGQFAITLDPKEKAPGMQPYQGIVPLVGDSVAAAIESYMLRSEQLETRLWLAADRQVARGMLLQKLPDAAGADDEKWQHAVVLGSTLKRDEMLGTGIETLLRRLFWEETIRLFDPQHPSFHCGCSRERVANMLKLLGRDEIESALAELGQLNIDCDFCGQHYEFDRVDCAQLFAANSAAEGLRPASGVKH
jgi:molecular chaperone Hsp33